MTEMIDITVSARVKNGPTVGFTSSLQVDAYDKLQVTIPAGSNETIQLIPIATTVVQCLFIQSNIYSTDVSYQVNGAGTQIILDTPQNFVGAGAISALDALAPSTLDFTNNLVDDDITINILIGRSAVI